MSKVLENAPSTGNKKQSTKAQSSRQSKGSKNVKVNNLVGPDRNFQLLKNFLSSMRGNAGTNAASSEALP